MDLAQLAHKFATVSQRVGHALQGSVEEAVVLLEESAKSAIGTYEFGWPPLSPSTVARKGADTPLLETGQLRDSIEHTVGKAEAWVGSSDPKAVWMEMGTSRGIPPRPFMGGALNASQGQLQDAFGERMIKGIFTP